MFSVLQMILPNQSSKIVVSCSLVSVERPCSLGGLAGRTDVDVPRGGGGRQYFVVR